MATVLEWGFRIGPWEIRPSLGTVAGPGGVLHLEPKVMGVLICLAEHAGEVVTRDQFVERVWRGRIVSDEVLSRCISLLRTSLGDNPRDPRFIQTLPKIGYRLIAPVVPLEPATATLAATAREMRSADIAEATIANPRSGFRRWSAIGLAAAVLLAAWLFVGRQWLADYDSPAVTAAQPSVVVLPFVNHSDDRDNEYFSDGLTEELIDRLAHVPELQVVASTSAFAFKKHREDVRTIAEQLGVSFVVEGNVRKENDQVRVMAQLSDARRGFQLWSKTFETTLGGIFLVQDDIANAIVAELRPRLAGNETALLNTTRPTEVIPAYELLLQGRYHVKRREEAPIRRGMELFEQAIELDPSFGDAYRELARAYVLLPTYSSEDEEEMFDMAVATIERGVAADPTLRDSTHEVPALLHFNRWEWVEAERAFRRALMAAPNDPNVRQWYSQLLASVGRPEESLRHMLEAKKLDVLSPVVNDRLAVAHMWADDDQRARQQFELADELGMGPAANPEAYVVLLLRQGDYDKAREILVDAQKPFARASDWVDPFIAALRDPAARPAAEEALAVAARGRNISLMHLFGAWIYVGNADAAIDVAFEMLKDPAEFYVEFLFARETVTLRCHPRFNELTAAIRLDDYWDQYGWPTIFARPGEVSGCD